MKPRADGFLAEDKIDHSSEIFDYIKELHLVLWEFCRYFRPGCGGSLTKWIETILPEVRSAVLIDESKLDAIKEQLRTMDAGLHETAMRNHQQVLARLMEIRLDTNLKWSPVRPPRKKARRRQER